MSTIQTGKNNGRGRKKKVKLIFGSKASENPSLRTHRKCGLGKIWIIRSCKRKVPTAYHIRIFTWNNFALHYRFHIPDGLRLMYGSKVVEFAVYRDAIARIFILIASYRSGISNRLRRVKLSGVKFRKGQAI